MTINDKKIKELLDNEVSFRNINSELNYDKPDPLMVASRYNDEFIILLCALFAYGNAKLIVKFLDSLDFSLLEKSDEIIDKELDKYYYRFQNAQDIKTVFKTFKRLKNEDSLNLIFLNAYKKDNSILEGIDALIQKIHNIANYNHKASPF